MALNALPLPLYFRRYAPWALLYALCTMPHTPYAFSFISNFRIPTSEFSLPRALYALGQSLNEKLDQLFFLVGFHDFITAGFGPGRKIGQ